MTRVLITGSRTWENRAVIEEALLPYTRDRTSVLVSGACPIGADLLAEEIWMGYGLKVERHPADWSKGRGAGFIRNQAMVDLGADVCLAFRRAYSTGTTHCANAATMAGIPTYWFTEDEDE